MACPPFLLLPVLLTRSPDCLLRPSGLDSVWPKLVSLEVCGWAIDASSVTAIRQLEALTSLKLQGGRDPGTALHARLLLPLLNKPGLRKLLLLDVRTYMLEGERCW